MQYNTAQVATGGEYVDEWCDWASPCPCGCGWVMCGVYGDWRDRSDCDGCADDTKETEEDDGEQEEE